jgi:hypothetical protein
MTRLPSILSAPFPSPALGLSPSYAASAEPSPSPATLADFDYGAQPGVDPKLITDLASCRYLATATNVLLIGARGR